MKDGGTAEQPAAPAQQVSNSARTDANTVDVEAKTKS
jgi:hypothetical protein